MVEPKTAAIMVVVFVVLFIVLLGAAGIFSGFGGFGPTEEKPCNLPGQVCAFGSAIGFPSSWLRTDTFIWYAFIPLMGVWMIIFGFLDRIRIFKGSINAVLALLIAFSMIPLGIFVLIVSLLFSVMGVWSVALFVGLFFIGTYLYSKGLIFGWRGYTGSYDQAILSQEKLKDELKNKLQDIVRETYDAEHSRGRYTGVGPAAAAPIIQRLQIEALDVRKQFAACEAQIDHFKRSKGRSKKVWKRLQKT